MKNTERRINKYTVIGSFSGYNAGDTAILEAILSDINKYDPTAIVVLPGASNTVIKRIKRFGINVIVTSTSIKDAALRFFSKETIQHLKSSNAVFLTAGVIFGRKFLDFRYSFMSSFIPAFKIAKKSNPFLKLIVYHGGVTLDGNRFSNGLILNMLNQCDIIAFRHSIDYKLIGEKINLNHVRLLQSCDNVLHLQVPPPKKVMLSSSSSTINIGLNFSAYSAISTDINWETFVQEEIEHLLLKFPQALFVVYQTTVGDECFAKKIIEKMNINMRIISLADKSLEEIDSLFQNINVFIGMRMHSLIFSLRNQIPIIGLTYDRKVECLLKDFGLEKYIIPIEKGALEMTCNLVENLLENVPVILKIINTNMNQYNEIISHNNKIIWEDCLWGRCEVGVEEHIDPNNTNL